MTNFLITGATGNLGGAALHTLQSAVSKPEISVLVRTQNAATQFLDAGISVRIGDYSDPRSLHHAFEGIDRLLFVSSPVLNPAVRTAQHRNVVEAAVTAGIGHVVYTSAMGAPHDPGHTSAEQALAEKQGSYTILRNGLYTDPFVALALAQSLSGSIRSASGSQRIVTSSIGDLGEAAVRALLDPPRQLLWELRGPSWSFDELAATLTRLTGGPVRHELVSDAETGAFSLLFPLVRRGVFSAETSDLEELLGREPQGIETVATQQMHRDS